MLQNVPRSLSMNELSTIIITLGLYCLFVPFSLQNVCGYHKVLYISVSKIERVRQTLIDSYFLYFYGIEVEMKRNRIL